MRARIFFIMQYEKHPETGETLITEDKIKEALIKHKSIKKWAYIRHDEDVYSAKDEEDNPLHKQGEKKPPHFHLALKCENSVEVSIVAKWFGIPENFVDVPKGGNRSFLDCVRYLTHEDEKQQALGKHFYEDEKVKANFDFRKEIIENLGENKTEAEIMFEDVLKHGKTLKECIEENTTLYIKHMDKLKKLRTDYINDYAEVPKYRINYYIEGAGGIGKNTCSKAYAKALYPDLDKPYFEVGGSNVSFEGYDGEPVIIWNDQRAVDLVMKFGRGELFDIFDSHPTTGKHNVKYGSVKLINAVHIVNGVEPYKQFLDNLAGEYTNKFGEFFEAEDKNQAYRRFPIITCLHEEDFDVLLNKGVAENTREFQQYIGYKNVRGSFAKLSEKLSGMAKEVVLIDMSQPMLELSSKIKDNHTQLIEDVEKIPDEFKGYGTNGAKTETGAIDTKENSYEEKLQKEKEERQRILDELGPDEIPFL